MPSRSDAAQPGIDWLDDPTLGRLPPPAAPATSSRRLVRPLYVVALVLNDIVATIVAFALGYWLFQLHNERAAATQPSLWGYGDALALLLCILVATFALRRLYIPHRDASSLDLLGTIAVAASIASITALAISAFWTRGIDVPRSILVWAWAGGIVLTWLGRLVLRAVLAHLRRRGWDEARVLIVGAGQQGRLLQDYMRAAPELGYRVVGFLDQPDAARGDERLLGTPDDLPRVVRAYGVSEVLVALPSLSPRQIVELVGHCAHERVSIKVFPDFFQIMAAEVTPSELSGLPLLRIRDVSLRGWNRALKRAVDLAGSGALLVLFAPLLLGLALLVKLTSPRGPVFFVQERLGLDNRPFLLLKFRSMHADAEQATGPVMAQAEDDERTYPLGRFMRRLSIDELPQLVNVLLGEMSLVGPRPERPHFVEQFEQMVPRYRDRHQEKAGMTGWAQVNGLRGQSSIEERTRYDLFYVEHWSLLFDLKILLKTIAAVMRGRNAY